MIIGLFAHRRRWLSNFYNTPIHYKGRFTEVDRRGRLIPYASVEHAYQAQKATNRHDHRDIANAPGAAEARRRARAAPNRGDFHEFKEFLMLRLLYAKFVANRDLRKKLLATFPHELIHGNTHGDEFWGINRRTGEGENKLGKQLMLLRDMFRAGTQDQILAVEARKKRKIEEHARWKKRKSEQLKEANKGIKPPPRLTPTWEESKILYPRARDKGKRKIDLDDGLASFRARAGQEQIKQDTKKVLRKVHGKVEKLDPKRTDNLKKNLYVIPPPKPRPW